MTPEPSSAADASAGALGPWIERALEIGGGVVPALEALLEEVPAARRGGWRELCRTLAAGDEAQAARALEADPDTWIPLLAAAPPGATTGDGVAEGRFLRRAVEVALRDEEDVRWWRPAIYPLVVLLLALGTAGILAAIVTPVFQSLMTDFGQQMPLITRAVLALGGWVRSAWWIVAAATVGLFVARILTGEWWLLGKGLPGSWFVRSGRFARHAADLLAAGVPADASVAAARRAVDPRAVSTPDGLPRWLSTTVAYALGAEVSAETRVRMLRRIADCHDLRLAAWRSWVLWCLGPLTVCLTGLFVLLLVLALFMPLVKLLSDLS